MTTIPAQIESLADQLKAQLDTEAEAKAAAETLKVQISALIGQLPDTTTYKVAWGQLQNVTYVEWAYRDSTVTEATKALERAEAQVKHLKEALKGAQSAAKAAKKARQVGSTIRLRVVRGK